LREGSREADRGERRRRWKPTEEARFKAKKRLKLPQFWEERRQAFADEGV